MKKSLSFLFAFVFLAMAFFVLFQVGFVSASSNVLNVCPSGCSYSTIQSAINAANPGDTVLVGPGEYAGTVNVTKSINLEGVVRASSPIIGGSILVTSSDVNISKFTIVNPTGSYGIKVSNAGNIKIVNNEFRGIGTALLDGSAQAIEIDSSSNESNFLIQFNSIYGVGNVNLKYGPNSNSAKGIYLESSADISNVEILNNVINRIYASNNSMNSITSGDAGAYGILVNSTSSNLQISQNQISDLGAFLSLGIALSGNTPEASITSNTMSDLVSPKADSAALSSRLNPSLSSINLKANSLDGNPTSLSSSSITGFAISNNTSGSPVGIVVLILILAVGGFFAIRKKVKSKN